MFGGMIIIWVLIIGGIVWFVKYMADQNQSAYDRKKPQKDAVEILNERYALGEISREEFEERRNVLGN
jgi:putative membrane protein